MKLFKPYKKADEEPNDFVSSFWYFDDKRKGFNEEPFLLGMSEFMTDMVEYFIKEEVENFHLLMSEEDFPSSQCKLNYGEEHDSYIFHGLKSNEHDNEFAIDPKLVSLKNFIEKYFGKKPETIYLRVEKQVKW